jgi:hypothetical protein
MQADTVKLKSAFLIKITFQWITNRDNTEIHIYLSLLPNVECNSGQERGNASPKHTHYGHCPQMPDNDYKETISSHKPMNKSKSHDHSKSLPIIKLCADFKLYFTAFINSRHYSVIQNLRNQGSSNISLCSVIRKEADEWKKLLIYS